MRFSSVDSLRWNSANQRGLTERSDWSATSLYTAGTSLDLVWTWRGLKKLAVWECLKSTQIIVLIIVFIYPFSALKVSSSSTVCLSRSFRIWFVSSFSFRSLRSVSIWSKKTDQYWYNLHNFFQSSPKNRHSVLCSNQLKTYYYFFNCGVTNAFLRSEQPFDIITK